MTTTECYMQWSERELQQVAYINMGQAPSSSSYNEAGNGLPFLQGCAQFGKRFPSTHIFCSTPTKIAKQGEILLSVRAPVGLINIADQDYCIGRGVASIQGNGIANEYLVYLIAFNVEQLKTKAQGTTFGAINSRDIQSFVLRIAPTNEQRKIAQILTTVDNLIEQTEAAIDKYQAIKQGMMQDFFSRGIDVATGQLRPSRQEAPELYKETKLGWVPKDWRLASALNICEDVIDCKNRTPPETTEGHPVIKTTNIRNGMLLENGLTYTHEDAYRLWIAKGLPQPGDILITREAPIGEVCMIPPNMTDACLGQRIMMYKPDPKEMNNRYMLYHLQSHAIQKRLVELAGGSTVGHVKVDDIRELSVLVPNPEEQQLIAEKLDIINNQIKQLSDELGKYQNLKLGIMQDLLTGKVRVKRDDTEVKNE